MRVERLTDAIYGILSPEEGGEEGGGGGLKEEDFFPVESVTWELIRASRKCVELLLPCECDQLSPAW